MTNRTEKVIQELQKVAHDANETFDSLSAEQLNWKPAEKSWSIAQCFDHLITTHGLYFPELERLASGDKKSSFWEGVSPFSGFFGKFLIKSLDPKNLKPMKTTGKAQPSASVIGDDIVKRFCAHQEQLIEHLQKLPGDLDPERTIITSPLLGIVTYSLADTFTILVVHCQRHFNQAKRVTEMEGFPI